MCRVGLSLYQMLDGELISGQDVLYYFIGGWYVSKCGVNTGALVLEAWRARECSEWRSVAID